MRLETGCPEAALVVDRRRLELPARGGVAWVFWWGWAGKAGVERLGTLVPRFQGPCSALASWWLGLLISRKP